MQRLDALFDIERGVNGKSSAERLAVRQELSAPLMAELHTSLTEQVAIAHLFGALAETSLCTKHSFFVAYPNCSCRYSSVDCPCYQRPSRKGECTHHRTISYLRAR